MMYTQSSTLFSYFSLNEVMRLVFLVDILLLRLFCIPLQFPSFGGAGVVVLRGQGEVNEVKMRLLKKHICPERAQSIAYGHTPFGGWGASIRKNNRQTLSPERAQSIGCQAFSLRDGVATMIAGRCPALLMSGLRPLPLRGFTGIVEKKYPAKDKRLVEKRRRQEHRIPSGMQPDFQLFNQSKFIIN